jgi:hypothetical protein
MTRMIPSPILLMLAVALAGCASPLAGSPTGDGPSNPGRPTLSAPDLVTIPPSDEPAAGDVPSDIIARLVADASERTGEEPDAIEVVQAAAVTWNDGSLGCPEPGVFYTQALVDGYHVILQAGDEELDYRVGAQGGFRLCEGGGRPSG